MIDSAIEACATIGLLARPVPSQSKQDILDGIHVGEADWSCMLSLAYHHGKEEETRINTDFIWAEVKEGPMIGHSFPLKELLNEGLLGVWQLLGGRELRSNLLEGIRAYNDTFYGDIPDVNLEQDIESALDSTLKDLVHDDDQKYHIFNAKKEASAADRDDAVVYDFCEDEPTQPFFMPNLNQNADNAQMSAQ